MTSVFVEAKTRAEALKKATDTYGDMIEERIEGTQTKGERAQDNLVIKNYLRGAAKLAAIAGLESI